MAEDPSKPEVVLDYFFYRREEESQSMVALLAKDRYSRAVRAKQVAHKGVCEEVAVDAAEELIKGFGHQGGILIKTDNEPALKSLREAVMQRLQSGATSRASTLFLPGCWSM